MVKGGVRDQHDIVKLSERYYVSAKRQLVAFYTAVLYKTLYQAWKTAMAHGARSNWSLVDFTSNLPAPVRRIAQCKAKRVLSTLALIYGLDVLAQDQVAAALDKVRQSSCAHIRRRLERVKRITENTSSAMSHKSETTMSIIQAHIEQETLRLVTDEIKSQLQAHQSMANNHLVAVATSLYEKRAHNDGAHLVFRKWSQEILRSYLS